MPPPLASAAAATVARWSLSAARAAGPKNRGSTRSAAGGGPPLAGRHRMERARGNGLPTPTRYAPAPLRALTDDAADDRGRPLHLVAADVEMGDGPQPPRTERDEQHPRLGELGEHGVHRVPFPHEIDHHDVRLRCGWADSRTVRH